MEYGNLTLASIFFIRDWNVLGWLMMALAVVSMIHYLRE